MRVILHAGQHKTGSTAIQAALQAHRALLRGAGIHVPAEGMRDGGNYRPLIDALTEPGEAEDLLRAAGAAWREAAGRGDRILVSAEYVKTLVVEGRGVRLVQALRELGATDITLVLYLRNPFELANSAFTQRTAVLLARGRSFKDHIAALYDEAYFNYRAFLELEDTGIGLEVLPYADAARSSIVSHFFRFLGVTAATLPEEPRLNAAFGPLAVEALRRLAIALPGLRRRHRVPLKERCQAIALTAAEPSPFWGVDEEARSLLEAADHATDAFAQAVWGVPWRARLPDAERPLNIFDPRTASAEDKARYETLLDAMCAAARGLGLRPSQASTTT